MGIKIFVDARPFTKVASGVSNYFSSAITAMAKQDDSIHFTLLADKEITHTYSEYFKEYSNINTLIIPAANFFQKQSIIWYNSAVPKVLNKMKPDFFWAPLPLLPINKKHCRDIIEIVTVHDFAYKIFWKTLSWQNKIAAPLFYDAALRRAKIIFSVSQYTKRELRKRLPMVADSRITVGSSIDDSRFFKKNVSEFEKVELLKKLNISNKFFLFVGTVEPRKNLQFLLSIMPSFVEKGYYLLIVGSKGWGKSNLDSIFEEFPNMRNFVKFSGFVSDNELNTLYNIATLLVSTSHNEGFGLPQLEAMSCACPVVSADNSAMTEVVNGGGVLVKGWKKDDWIHAIDKVLKNIEYYRELAHKRSLEFNWDDIAQDYINIIMDFRKNRTNV